MTVSSSKNTDKIGVVKRILFNSDPADGGTPASEPTPQSNPTPPPEPTTTPPAPPPPVTSVVVTGEKSERETDLERQLESEKSERKKAEMNAGIKEAELQQLKELQARTPRKVKKVGAGWFEYEEEN